MPLGFFDPNDPLGLNKLLGGGGGGNVATAAPQPQIRPPAFTGGAGIQVPQTQIPAYNVTGPAQQTYQAGRQVSQANGNLVQFSNPANPYQQNAYNANMGVLNARSGLIPLQQGVLQARQGTIAATGAQNASQRSYYNLLGGILQQRRADSTRLTAAENNIGDQTNVALARQAQQGEDARYSQLGIAAPQRIDTPAGDNTVLPAGVERNIRPQEAYVGEQITQAERGRTADLSEAQNRTSLAGADVADARLRESVAGTALDYGELGVTQAGLQSDYADLQARHEEQGLRYLSSLAKYNYEESQVPPEAGLDLYKSKLTGESFWTSPVDSAKREAIDRAVLGSPNDLVQLIGSGLISQDDALSSLVSLGVPQGQAQQVINSANTAIQKRNAPAAAPVGSPSGGNTARKTVSEDDLITELVANPGLGGLPEYLFKLVEWFKSKGYDQKTAQYKAGEIISAAERRMKAANKQSGSENETPQLAGRPQ